MSSSRPAKRYIVNKLLDVNGVYSSPNANYWTQVLSDIAKSIINNITPAEKNADGGLYVGTPGIAYAFYRLIRSPLAVSHKEEYMALGIQYIDSALKFVETQPVHNATDLIGFILGAAGFRAVAAVLYDSTSNKTKVNEHLNHFINYHTHCNPSYPVPFGGNELFVGRAGYLLGVLWLQKELQKQILPVEKINEICDFIIQDGRRYATAFQSPAPLMYSYYDTEYIGAAHGISAILFSLLCCENYLTNHPEEEQIIKKSVDFILSLQMENGNFLCALDEVNHPRNENNELVHWCHGAPGVIYLMAKASLRWREDKYLKSCIKCGDVVWEKGLLKKGPGICHGVSGNGYVFLLLYRLTKDEKYLWRANAFADFMMSTEFKSKAKTPDSPYSLYEGLAGTICYILDLFEPDKAAFPFMDVF